MPYTPGTPGYTPGTSYFANNQPISISINGEPENENKESESPGLQLLKELSNHIEKTTGIAPTLELKQTKPSLSTPIQIENNDSDEYGYSEAFNKMTLQELMVKLERGNLSKLPHKCFYTAKVPVLREDEALDDPNDPYPLPTDLEEERTYLLSKYVSQHFSATFYEMTRELGVSDVATAAQIEGVRIKCRNERIDRDDAKEIWQDFVPCVDVPFWPGMNKKPLEIPLRNTQSL